MQHVFSDGMVFDSDEAWKDSFCTTCFDQYMAAVEVGLDPEKAIEAIEQEIVKFCEANGFEQDNFIDRFHSVSGEIIAILEADEMEAAT